VAVIGKKLGYLGETDYHGWRWRTIVLYCTTRPACHTL